MLNWTTVLKYIKGRLALPSTFIEKTDDQIREWVEITAIPEFSQYFPDVERTGINTESDLYKDPERQHTFLFFDDERLDILGIKECYFSQGDLIIAAHPFMGPFSMSAYKNWALAVFQARSITAVSNFNYTWKFFPPNKLQILSSAGAKPGLVVIEYEREHPKDLRRIPASMKMLFQDLALSHVMIMLGDLRGWYSDRLTTPFGDIPLNSEALRSDGRELHDKIIEKLEVGSLPPVVIDYGD